VTGGFGPDADWMNPQGPLCAFRPFLSGDKLLDLVDPLFRQRMGAEITSDAGYGNL
jgi:hypothetical protein